MEETENITGEPKIQHRGQNSGIISYFFSSFFSRLFLLSFFQWCHRVIFPNVLPVYPEQPGRQTR